MLQRCIPRSNRSRKWHRCHTSHGTVFGDSNEPKRSILGKHGKFTLAAASADQRILLSLRSDKEKKDHNSGRQYCSCEDDRLKILPHKARRTAMNWHPASVAR